MTNTPIRLSVSEAAKFFGVNEKTIRRALKDEELRYVVVQGRYKISFESLLKWSQKNLSTQAKLNQDGLGQYVDKWKINNKLYSPNPGRINNDESSNR
jgi:excisionase family DNA binding protein